jgi:hypothetical protein
MTTEEGRRLDAARDPSTPGRSGGPDPLLHVVHALDPEKLLAARSLHDSIQAAAARPS